MVGPAKKRVGRASTPRAKYGKQKNSAARRGIAWNFNFDDWWRVWTESGKWGERGRSGYVMARHNDGDTPYSPETVYICTQSQNSKDGFLVVTGPERAAKCSKTRDLKRAQFGPHPTTEIRRQARLLQHPELWNRELGNSPTPEQLMDAYLAAAKP